jgi:hypothetical protein
MFIIYLNLSDTKLKLFLTETPVSLQGSEVKLSVFIYKSVSQLLISINVSDVLSYTYFILSQSLYIFIV